VRCQILIIDDEKEMCISLSRILNASGFESEYTTHPLAVKRRLAEKHFDLIVMDIRMPEISGLDLLQQVRAAFESIPVIMISAYASVENIVAAMKVGALNFYQKPINIDMLIAEITRISHSAELKGAPPFPPLSSCNARMGEALRQSVKIAKTSAPVLLCGESGTGKEVVATLIHENSVRSSKPFVKINCASIPEALFESELFGYEPGAFTDARRLHRGRFEMADGGTLFFDEIGEMGMETQAKLLRVLQEKEFERLGGSHTIKSDVRIIAATNTDINRLIEKKRFREDLFYRLAVVVISLPPLRERREDILPLARHFLEQFSGSYGRSIPRISPDVESLLCDHSWPGNVRELKNCIERAVIFNETGELQLQDLAFQYEYVGAQVEPTMEQAHDQLSRQIIVDALAKSGGVKQKAADYLKIHRKTLYNQMKKLGIE
jgi:DNA-binding NtrC family response regulator